MVMWAHDCSARRWLPSIEMPDIRNGTANGSFTTSRLGAKTFNLGYFIVSMGLHQDARHWQYGEGRTLSLSLHAVVSTSRWPNAEHMPEHIKAAITQYFTAQRAAASCGVRETQGRLNHVDAAGAALSH
ncbi:hypothetical protein FB451DRAFT_1166697 [Mycena latifolia]|nr:hypothetical protein FB451DRAFT_1166697 [Mycena latifolia]